MKMYVISFLFASIIFKLSIILLSLDKFINVRLKNIIIQNLNTFQHIFMREKTIYLTHSFIVQLMLNN